MTLNKKQEGHTSLCLVKGMQNNNCTDITVFEKCECNFIHSRSAIILLMTIECKEKLTCPIKMSK